MEEVFLNLLSPITINKTTFKNRLCVAPMGDGVYGNLYGAHGEFTANGLAHIIERARGGWGMYVSGSNIVDYKVDPFDEHCALMLHKADFKKRALHLNEVSEYHGMKIIQQISAGYGRNHAGLYSCSENDVFEMPGMKSPELTQDQIKMKIECVVEAAQLMKSSGFAGVEIHALHWGYLLDQFAMIITNRRKDEYGGTLENRLRICKEILEGIKQSCGSDFLVSMRLGVKSYILDLEKPSFTGENEAGRTLEEGIRIAKLLEQFGYDVLDVDVGMYDSFYYACPPMYIPQGFVIPLAEKVKEAVNIPVLCGSRMDDPHMADKAIADGKIDGAVLGRPSLADPYFPQKLQMGRPDKIRPCLACNVGCMGKLRTGEHISCAVNPFLRKESYYHLEKTLNLKKVVVIGGGVAGMEAARIAKMRGHDVTICEKTDRLGGLLIAAGAHKFKPEIGKLVEWYKSELKDLDVSVEYNTEMNPEKLDALKPDAVVFAFGSQPLMPPIEGINHPKCVSCVDVLEGGREVGDTIAVVGAGLVGCEIAIDYAMQGKRVTLIDAAIAPLSESKMINIITRQIIPDLLDHYNIKLKMRCKINAINDWGAVLAPVDGGDDVTVEADTVIMAIGMKSNVVPETELYGSGIEIHSIGDCCSVGNVYTAVHGAFEIASCL